MINFVEFETNELDGPITELCIVNDYGKIIVNKKGSFNFEEEMKNLIDSGEAIVFWHNYMPLYLSKFFPEIFNKLRGKFATFVDFYAIFDGLKQPSYKISEITEILTGRVHKGNAESDALDLYECYQKMK